MRHCGFNSVLAILCLCLAGTIPMVDSYRFMRCELTKTLLDKYRFPKTFISNWICLIEHESGKDTKKLTIEPPNKAFFGLFQIGNRDYCAMGRKGGYCNKNCQDFMDDNIDDDVECAKLIFDRQGFSYWRGWKRYCNPRNLPPLNTLCNYKK